MPNSVVKNGVSVGKMSPKDSKIRAPEEREQSWEGLNVIRPILPN
jgi:hypothetical protein